MIYSGYFDGATQPNPGEMGMGVSIVNNQQQEIDWGYAYKSHGTNNEAEYLSLILLLRQSLHYGVTELNCYGDSKLVIEQVNGKWSVSKDTLKPLHAKVVSLASHFEKISFSWIARDKNKRADELSRLGIEYKKSNRKERDQSSTSKNVATDIKVHSLEPKTKIIVRDLKNGNYLVVEPTETSIVNTRNMSCSCSAFFTNKQCKHINTLIGFQKQA